MRDRFGFTGAIVSDALDMAGASAGRGLAEAAVLALAAGCDLLCIGTDNTAEQLAEIRAAVLAALASGRLPQQRVFEAAERVATLSRGVAALRAAAPSERPEPPELTAAGFTIAGPLPALAAPLLVRLDSPDNIAAGDTVWGLADHLADEISAAFPGATITTLHRPFDLTPVLQSEGPVVVQGRDLGRVPQLTAAVADIRAARPDALIVELGWPDPSARVRPDVITYCGGRGTMLALLRALAERRR
ncbi:MAG: glycoside hydrolase family 3 N-terminal domain-containing protein [Micropruina glycogenica]